MNVLMLLPLALTLAAGPRQEIVSFGKEVVVPAGTTVDSVVAIGGAVTIDGSVREGVVAVGGPARVNGHVGDDLVSIGSASLGPKAVIDGELVVVGGALDADPAAHVQRQRTVVSVSGALKDHPRAAAVAGAGLGWLREGPMKLRVFPLTHAKAWAVALFLLLSYIILTLAAPGPVEACAAAVGAQPAQTLFVGILLLALAGPVSLIFVVTVFGIALLPALAGLALAAAWLGKAGLLRLMGGRALGSAVPAPLAVGAAGLLLAVLYAVPIVGIPLWSAATAWGLGAAALAGYEAARSEASRAASASPSPAVPAVVAAPVPAAAALSLPRAGFWPRLGAIAIDVVAVLVLAGLAPFFHFGIGAWALYQIGLWTWKGTTLGGIVVGLRGVRLDGRPMDLTVAAVRHLASYFSAFPALLGFFWAAWDPEGQTWHDKIAGTVVVRVPRGEPLV